MVPKPTKECTKCGVCVHECPVQAINPENPKKIDEKVCISCMRCISVCPHAARRVNPVMLSAVGLALKKVCSERKENELFIWCNTFIIILTFSNTFQCAVHSYHSCIRMRNIIGFRFFKKSTDFKGNSVLFCKTDKFKFGIKNTTLSFLYSKIKAATASQFQKQPLPCYLFCRPHIVQVFLQFKGENREDA